MNIRFKNYFIKYELLFVFMFLWISFFILGLLLGLVHMNQDDFEMLMIAKGEAPYQASSFIYYSSSILGFLYKTLYHNYGFFEWYNLIYLLFISLAFALVFSLLYNKFKGKLGLVLIVFLFITHLCLLLFLSNILFSHPAGVLIATSLISLRLLNDSIFNKKILWILICSVLMFVSSLYRFEIFLLIYFIGIFSYFVHDTLVLRKLNKKFYLIVILIGVFATGIRGIELSLRTKEQITFDKIYKSRSAFYDYNLNQKITNRKELEKKIDWGDTEKDLIRTWIIPDFDKFKQSNFDFFIENADKSKMMTFKYLKTHVHFVFNDLIFEDSNILFLFLYMILFAMLTNNQGKLLTPFLIIIFTLSIFIILSIYYKIPGHNVRLPFYLLIILYPLSIFNYSEVKDIKLNNMIFLLYCISLIFIIQKYRINHNIKKLNYSNVYVIDRELNKVNKTIFTLPGNYLGHVFYSGLKFSKFSNKSIVFCSMFIYHPSNQAFKTEWKKDAMLLKKELIFYFNKSNVVQMEIFANAFIGYTKQHYGLNYSKNIKKLLNQQGFLLELNK